MSTTDKETVGLWRDMESWEQWVSQYDHLNIEALEPYLCEISNEVRNFLHDDFTSILVDRDVASTWQSLVAELSEREIVTVLFQTVELADTQRHFSIQHTQNSNIRNHIVWAMLTTQLNTCLLTDVSDWIHDVDESNTAVTRIQEAIARHSPYSIRVQHVEQARSAYPYIPELVTAKDSRPNPDWWDTNAEWFTEESTFETFRDHLINHWTDSPFSQGGVIARDLAQAVIRSETQYEPEENNGVCEELSIPCCEPPSHLIEWFNRLREQAGSYYHDKNIEHVQLYRGVGTKTGTHSPLESWTDSRAVAEQYAGDDGYVLTAEIPVDAIMFSYETIPADRWSALAGYKAGPPTNELQEFAVLGAHVS